MSQYFGFPAGTQYPAQPAAAAAAAFQPPTVASAGYVQPAPAPAAAPASAYSAAAAPAPRPGAGAYADPTTAYGAPAQTVVTPTAAAQSYNTYTAAAQAAVAAAAHAVVGRPTVPTGHTPAASAGAAAAAAPTAAGLAPTQPAPPGVPSGANSAVSQAAAVAAGYTAGYTSSAGGGGYPTVSVGAGPGMQAIAGKSSISKTSYVVSPSSSATAANFAVASLPAGAAPTTSGSFSGYEAALYSAATSYYQQQHQQQQQQQQSLNAASLVAAVASNQHTGNSNNKTIVGGSVQSQLPQSLVRGGANREGGGGSRPGPGMRRGGQGNYGGGSGGGGGSTGNAGNVSGNVAGGRGNFHGRDQPVHYCEVCKISCAGPQTYKEHLEGQKHKKKEAALKAGQASSMRHGQKQLRCELCDVTCTGVDAYSAHIRGAKHLKTMKLHQRLGKPIPSNDPVVVKPALGSATLVGNTCAGISTSSANNSSAAALAKNAPANTTTAGPGSSKKVSSTPKITFVGSSTLKSVPGSSKNPEGSSASLDTSTSVSGSVASSSNTIMSYPANPTPTMRRSTGSVNIELTSGDTGTIVGTTTASGDVLERVDLMELQDKDQQQPVGYEYIEEISNEAGKVTQFHCKLCDCKFNDPNAKEMHLKGRRHRLQYKKKVDPSLEVDIKPNLRGRRVQEERMRRQQAREEFWRRRDMEERMREMQMMEWAGSIPPGGRPGMGMRGLMSMHGNGHMRGMNAGAPGGGLRRGETSDDKHVMAKHASVYPTEADLQAVQHIVSSCEKALKLVSDEITDEDVQAAECSTSDNVGNEAESSAAKTESADIDSSNSPTKTEMDDTDASTEAKETANASAQSNSGIQPIRILKGVMRVGVLAKGLLLHDCLRVDLVLLCSERPTVSILRRVANSLPKHLNTVSLNRKYHVDILESQACIRVKLDESETPDKSEVTAEGNRDVKRKDGEPSPDGEPRPVCYITLTNPNLRPDGSVPAADNSKIDTSDLLDKDKCLAALASLRHAKWFQANASSLQSCVLIIRILRDLCSRVPTWSPLKSWALEVLAEKVISSDGTVMSPGDALRRLFECIASGVLLPGGVGVQDPCEKEATDAAGNLSAQEREDITASAQHALRLIAFRQIHKVLDMDPLPPMHGGATGGPPGAPVSNVNRKRRLSGQESSANAGGEKKDKKDA